MLRFIQENRLIPNRQKLVVAVSGGADSVCLLHILSGFRKELGTRLHVAHLNHQLRGAASEADAAYVAELAESLKVPATIEARDVRGYCAQHHLSLEEAAREVRYAFLAGVAEKVGAGRVAVGHTADDQVETVLMHLLRGSGTRGLRGLMSTSRWLPSGTTIIRPLLVLSREETAAYCREHRLSPRLDASNLGTEPMRNRLRLQLLPQLKSYNPRVTEALLRTARLAADDLAFIEKEAARIRGKIAQRQGDTIVLNKKALLTLPPALKRHLLRAAIEELLGNLKDIEARHIEEIMEALDKPAGKAIVLPDGLTFTIEYERYLLGSDSSAISPFPPLGAEAELKIPGRTILPGWEIEAVITDPANIKTKATDSFTAHLDFEKAGKKLTVRRRRPGDCFQPLGMGQPKKLGEFMIDARIPQGWRPHIPIVSSPGQLVWVVGWRIDERVRVTKNTKKVLRLQFKRVLRHSIPKGVS